MISLLRDCQSQLARLYDLAPGASIDQFLVDADFADRLSPMASAGKETVLISEDGEFLSLGVYFHPDVSQHLQHETTRHALAEGAFPAFCAMVEGVSHFLVLDHHSQHDVPLTVLEMEIQAEVDKFILARIHSMDQIQERQDLQHLHQQLFSAFEIRESASPIEQERYRFASEAAARFCRSLDQEFFEVETIHWPTLLDHLRRFFRSPLQGKLRQAGL